jgi:hypothetical protein
MIDNKWELYSSKAGWSDASEKLDLAVAEAIVKLDEQVAAGERVPAATKMAFNAVLKQMKLPGLVEFGAADSEPRAHLAFLLRRHIRAKHNVGYTVSRFGDVT